MRFVGGRGFVTYPDLDGADRAEVERLVDAALAHYRSHPDITRVEWKTRAHDDAPGLVETLLARGFVADETESIMVGEAERLAVAVPLPDGVTLRRVHEEHDVRALVAMSARAFGDSPAEGEEAAAALLHRLDRERGSADAMELWVAEVAGEIVCAGRLEPVPGTEFAGIWGGCTLPEWRGQGIYRALTAARARSALSLGRTLIHSDSTEYSRPILERYGFVKVSETTPYRWVKDRPGGRPG